MRRRLAWLLRDFRVRIAVLLLAGVVMAGIGFDALVILLTERRLLEELDHRAAGYASLLAARVSTPLLLHDRAGLREELRRALQDRDVVGISVLDTSGVEFAREVRDPGRWVAGDAGLRELGTRDPSAAANLLLRRAHVREAWAKVYRERGPGAGALEELGERYGEPPDGMAGATIPVGSVRMLFSTAGVEEAVRTASRVGLAILLAGLALWLIPLFALLRVIARPLHEASELARDIAAGQLDRRIPVRSHDELGRLAESLNTMAGALRDAQARAAGEAEAMRRATEAVVAISQGARQASGLEELFRVVASQLRQMTGSRGAALALLEGESPVVAFRRFDPPLPWGELSPGRALDPDLVRRLQRRPVAPVRLDVEREDDSLARGLRRDGFRRALIVPLGTETGGGALLLASDRADSYPPSQMDVVMGLASHLGAALGAAALRARLESAVAELEDTRERLERSERMRLTGKMASGVAASPVAEGVHEMGTEHEEPGVRVMVVDDEPAVRELLRDILASLGHTPGVFDSGPAALAAYEGDRYDVVFTDLGMPGMSGWELARTLRDRDPAVTIAIITGWGSEVGSNALRDGGADAVVSKPFTIEDIEGLIRLARSRRQKPAA